MTRLAFYFKHSIRLLIIWGAVLATTAFGAGCAGKGEQRRYRIGFSQCGEADAWRRSMIQEMRRELAFHPQMELIYKQANDSSLLQIDQVRELLASGIDLLIISPNEAKPLTPIVEEVFNSGIPVIVVDRKIASSLYTNYIGADNYEIGRMAGQYAASLLKGKGRIVEVIGLPASSPAIERQRGFEAGIQPYGGIELMHKVSGDWVKPRARESLEKIGPDLASTDLIFAHNDVMALGAYEVCQATGAGDIRIIGVDALPGKGAGMEFVSNKTLAASLMYPTGGAESIQNAARILQKLPVSKETVLQTLVVDSSNVRMMSLQSDKIVSQQQDIEKQQDMITEQTRVYKSQRTFLYILGITLAVAIFLAGLLFYSRVVNRRINRQLARKNAEVLEQSEQLKELSRLADAANEAKLNFFTNISHEFRTPLSLILAPVEEMLQQSKLPPFARQPLSLIQKNTIRLFRLVNQLIDFRKIGFNKMQVKATETDLVPFAQDIIAAFQPIAQKRHIDCRLLTSERTLPTWFDTGMMDKVLFNLLSNAFKFTGDGGFITLTLEKDTADNVALIKVEDNGIGMSATEVERVFEAFYQGDYGNHKGSGLGLPLTKELVSLHHGRIQVRSEKNKGTVVTVTLPLGSAHFTAEELAATGEENQFTPEDQKLFTADLYPTEHLILQEADSHPPGKNGTILVIEDNPEMRSFLLGRLSPHYDVLQAENGITGLQQVFEQMPDLIICDVMMPGKDGMSLTRDLKKDVRTAHIPIILLTAKASTELQVEGLKAAADAYITKPFNFTLLEQTISSLLLNRTKVKDHFSSEIPGDIRVSASKKTDRRFVTDFTAIVERNLSNDHFSVDDICTEMQMSKIQLYRRVKALMDTSINEYILNTRIQKAKYYLQHEELTISEVAYKTGFSSPAYFSTVFKNKTGVSPKAFKGTA